MIHQPYIVNGKTSKKYKGLISENPKETVLLIDMFCRHKCSLDIRLSYYGMLSYYKDSWLYGASCKTKNVEDIIECEFCCCLRHVTLSMRENWSLVFDVPHWKTGYRCSKCVEEMRNENERYHNTLAKSLVSKQFFQSLAIVSSIKKAKSHG